jgi:hypothetical protein
MGKIKNKPQRLGFMSEPSYEEEVHHPSHYDVFPDLEAIEVIARSSTLAEFYGYCKGCSLKYRLRAGNKGDALVDLKKANEYIKLYDDWAHVTRDHHTNRG